ncbi:MAG: hypoxanthine phosphoribosyltransferase [Deltaproteobacteria bacterium RIFOXYA12_FULL_58_15]|nr:MAG: hypoxanthine phosphoribosyltransferase [Deltaproteobacteria bacterium RIFOXYA12_FULL_58_15]OGR10008.1 MAG: hypoxanthine phosphoribosyltransferase [Deltaproteobacteria bacterium RIFOXYB12_FULL_58_9]
MCSNSTPSSRWDANIEVLFDANTLASRIGELGRQITEDYRGHDVCLIGILKGCYLFLADLARQIDLPIATEFVGISSYGDDTESSGIVQITSDLTRSIEGLDILIVEDIIDTGLTMQYLLENLRTRRPKSIKVCSLLHKPGNTRVEVPVDYVGFTIPNKFVIGYGLDLAGRYRNLPYIGVYHGEV